MPSTPVLPALEIAHAKKNYGTVQALKGIDLTIPSGEFFGLLGPNGAGKTTLIQSIVGLIGLSSGSIKVFSNDVKTQHREAKKLIGYSPQEVNLERFFNISDIIAFQAGYYGYNRNQQKQRTAELLEKFGLTEKASVQFYKLSGGMQKRALIAKALVGNPKLLILDEPTAGVDVEQRHELWGYLKTLNKSGTTIILTTHYIDEAEALCERIGIINKGEIRELGSPQELIQKYCAPTVTIKTNNPIDMKFFGSPTDYSITQTDITTIQACGGRAGIMTQELLKTILDQPHMRVEDIIVKKGNLEDVFLKTTGQTLAEAEKARTKALQS